MFRCSVFWCSGVPCSGVPGFTNSQIDVMTFAGVDIHSFIFPSILNNQDFVIAKSNQNEDGSVVKSRLLLVDLFAVEFYCTVNLITKDHSYSVLATECGAMFCER